MDNKQYWKAESVDVVCRRPLSHKHPQATSFLQSCKAGYMKLNGATQLSLGSFKGQHKKDGSKLVNGAQFYVEVEQSWILQKA